MKTSVARTLTLWLAVAMLLQSAGGLLMQGLYRDRTWTVVTYRGMDWTTLLLATPVLLWSMRRALRGVLRARVIWLGMLYYAFYNNLYYLIGAAYNRFFLLYVAINLLSLAALAAVLVESEIAELGAVPASAATRRAVAVIAFVCAVLLSAMWVGQSLVFIVNSRLPQLIVDTGGNTDLVGLCDLNFIAPLLIVGGVWLLRQRPWGMVISSAMMVQCLMITISLIVVSAVSAAAGIANAWSLTPLWTAMGLAFLTGAVLLLRVHPRA